MTLYRVIDEDPRYLVEVTYPGGTRQIAFICATRADADRWIADRLTEAEHRPQRRL